MSADHVTGLRIALVGPVPPPAGGMAGQTSQLADALRSEGMLVDLIPTNAPYRPEFVGKLRGLRAIFRLTPYVRTLWQRVNGKDLVHVMANSGWSWYLFVAPAVWVACAQRVPVVLAYHGGEAEDFFSSSWKTVRPTLMRVSRVLVPSRYLQVVFEKRGIAASVVPNIVDLDRFGAHGRDTRATHSPHVLVARNLEKIYDLPTAIRAFARIRRVHGDARLTVAGTGAERDALETLADALDVQSAVTFTGQVDNADMAALFVDADILLNPSLADNAPISIVESLASGVPVVSTDVGGIPYLVRDGETARLIPPRDPVAMASAILEVLADGELRSRLIRNGLACAEKFRWSSVRGQLMEAYRSILSRPSDAVTGTESR